MCAPEIGSLRSSPAINDTACCGAADGGRLPGRRRAVNVLSPSDCE